MKRSSNLKFNFISNYLCVYEHSYLNSYHIIGFSLKVGYYMSSSPRCGKRYIRRVCHLMEILNFFGRKSSKTIQNYLRLESAIL